MSPVRPSFTVVSLLSLSIFLAYEVSDTQPNRMFLDLVVAFSDQWKKGRWVRMRNFVSVVSFLQLSTQPMLLEYFYAVIRVTIL